MGGVEVQRCGVGICFVYASNDYKEWIDLWNWMSTMEDIPWLVGGGASTWWRIKEISLVVVGSNGKERSDSFGIDWWERWGLLNPLQDVLERIIAFGSLGVIFKEVTG